ncbi:MAG: TonB-dependent receptor, partial [Cyclobacteriaceae bacterium]
MHLDSITIYTSRVNSSQAEIGRNVSVIDAKRISELPVNSLDELLRYIPGIESQARNGFGVQADFIIRGSTYNQVLVVVDGIRMNDPLTGHFNAYIPVTPAEIERIEVLRGPASSIYGADAVGGVINIITKAFSQQNSENTGQAELLIGENNLRSVNAGGYLSKKNWQFSGGLQSNVSDGQRLPSGGYNYFKVHTVSASAGYRFDSVWKLAGRYGFAYRDFSAKYFYTRSPLDQSTEEVKNNWAQLQMVRDRQNKRSEFNLSYKQTSDVFEFNPDFPSVNSHITRLMLFQFNRSVQFNKVSLGWGIQVDNRSIESNDRGDHDDWHAGVYGILNYSGIENLMMNVSVRGDYDENYNFEISPQLNIAYSLGKWVLRGAAGRGIRAADYTERFISNNLPGPLTPGRNLGNPNLEAERSWTYEAGFDYYPVNGMRVVATVFRRSANNLIDYVIKNSGNIENNGNLENDAEYFYATNISNA